MSALVDGFASCVEELRTVLMDVPGLGVFASEPFLFRPLLLLVALGIAAGPLGALVNLRRAEFNAEATVHAVFPGLVIGFALGGIDGVVLGAGVVGVIVAAVLTAASRRPGGNEGATAVLLASFFAAGLTISLRKGDMSGQLEALMFGRLLESTDADLLRTLIAAALVLLLVGATWKEQIAVAFDREGARVIGIRLVVVDATLNVAIAGLVVAASAALGVLLGIAYLVIPGAAARLLAPAPMSLALAAAGVGVVGGIAGLGLVLVDAPRPLSPQGVVVLALLVLLLGAVAVSRLRSTAGEAR